MPHVLGIKERRHEENILSSPTNEEMKKDLPAVIRKVATTFLNKTLTEENVAKLTEHSQPEYEDE